MFDGITGTVIMLARLRAELRYTIPRLRAAVQDRRAREWWELSSAGFILQYRVLAVLLHWCGCPRPFTTRIGRMLYTPRDAAGGCRGSDLDAQQDRQQEGSA